MGNPLYRSPIYNDDGTVEVKDNRFVAFHLGVSGKPNDNLAYRLLATYQEGLGTYNSPYTKPRHNVSVMAEATYMLGKSLKGWSVRGADAMARIKSRRASQRELPRLTREMSVTPKRRERSEARVMSSLAAKIDTKVPLSVGRGREAEHVASLADAQANVRYAAGLDSGMAAVGW